MPLVLPLYFGKISEKVVDKANLRAYTCKKTKTKLTKEGWNKSMAQLNTAMNYTFYFYFRGFIALALAILLAQTIAIQ